MIILIFLWGGGGIDYQLIIFIMKYQDVGSEFFPPRAAFRMWILIIFANPNINL